MWPWMLTNYQQRSRVETYMFSYKVILGGQLQAGNLPQQQTEAKLGCKTISHMPEPAKPQSEKVA